MANETKQSDLLAKLKDAATLLGGVTAISYAAGFVVVTTNLLQYGIGDLSLLNARYVSAGFFFLFLLTLSLVPAISSAPYLLRRILEVEPEEPPMPSALAPVERSLLARPSATDFLWRTIPAPLTWLLSFATVSVSLAVILIASTRTWLGQDTLTWSSAETAFSILFWGWYAPQFGAGLLIHLIPHPKSKKRWLFNIPNRFWLIGGILLCLMWATKNYAVAIYPRINPATGGGDAVEIRLVAGKETAEILGQVVPLETGSSTTVLRLLDQSDKVYFVLVPDSAGRLHAVQVDKSLVKGVIYASSP